MHAIVVYIHNRIVVKKGGGSRRPGIEAMSTLHTVSSCKGVRCRGECHIPEGYVELSK